MQTISQTEQIRKHLESGRTITPLEALNDYGCMRLGARVLDLKREGMAIHSRLISRNGKRFAEYSAILFGENSKSQNPNSKNS